MVNRPFPRRTRPIPRPSCARSTALVLAALGVLIGGGAKAAGEPGPLLGAPSFVLPASPEVLQGISGPRLVSDECLEATRQPARLVAAIPSSLGVQGAITDQHLTAALLQERRPVTAAEPERRC